VADSSISKKQWVSRLEVWGLKKNIASNEMSNIVRIQRKRKADDSKDTRFMVRGRVVAQENIDRWEKRQHKAPTGRDFALSPQPGNAPLDSHMMRLQLISCHVSFSTNSVGYYIRDAV